jgi:soluble lytic murein transglycosylase-like protein
MPASSDCPTPLSANDRLLKKLAVAGLWVVLPAWLILGHPALKPAWGEALTFREAGSATSIGSAGLFERAARYENGESVSRDYRRARVLYCDAASQGDSRAWLALAWLFMNARGVARDDHAAAFWLQKAAAGGVPQAANLLHVLGTVTPIDRGCAPPAGTTPAAADPLSTRPASPMEPAALRDAIERTAQDAGVSARLLASIVVIESANDAAAVSSKGAMGLMQLMPTTAERFHVENPFDYRENLAGGAAYIRSLLEQFGGNLSLALAAYNAGEGAVAAYRGIPPYAETQAFIRMVTELCATTEVTNTSVKTNVGEFVKSPGCNFLESANGAGNHHRLR